jgi:hypothetical protein
MEDKINKIKSNKNLTNQEKYREIQKLLATQSSTVAQ